MINRWLKKLFQNRSRSAVTTYLVAVLWIICIGTVFVQYLEFKRSNGILKTRERLFETLEEFNKNHAKGEKRRLPRMIGIGVKKCGTDGVLRFLEHHPLVKVVEGQETFYFTNGFRRGIDYYKKRMPLTNERQFAMEKTPVYYLAPPESIPRLIKELVPGVKLFLIVCDPAERAFSDYVHERIRFNLYNDPLIKDYDTFEKYVDKHLPKVQALTRDWEEGHAVSEKMSSKFVEFFRREEAASLLSNGIYAAHWGRWMRHFNRSSLLIINGNSFLNDPGTEMERLQDFLGLPKVLLRRDFVRRPDTGYFCYLREKPTCFLDGSDSPPLGDLKCLHGGKGRTRNGRLAAEEKTLQRLRDFYEPFNREFYRQVGIDFKW